MICQLVSRPDCSIDFDFQDFNSFTVPHLMKTFALSIRLDSCFELILMRNRIGCCSPGRRSFLATPVVLYQQGSDQTIGGRKTMAPLLQWYNSVQGSGHDCIFKLSDGAVIACYRWSLTTKRVLPKSVTARTIPSLVSPAPRMPTPCLRCSRNQCSLYRCEQLNRCTLKFSFSTVRAKAIASAIR